MYKGDAEGRLLPVNIVGLENTPTAFTLCDFDGDLFKDAAVTLGDGHLYIYYSNGMGYFSDNFDSLGLGPDPAAAAPVDIVVMDVDDDTLDDLAIANNGTRTISIVRRSLEQNYFDATFMGSAGSEDAAPVALAVGDFENVTGLISDDLIVATKGGTIELFMMSGESAVWVDYDAATNNIDAGSEWIVDMTSGTFFGAPTPSLAILVTGADPVISPSGSYINLVKIEAENESDHIYSGVQRLVLEGADPVVIHAGVFANKDGDLAVGNGNCVIELFLQDSPGSFRHETMGILAERYLFDRLTDITSGLLTGSGVWDGTGEDLVIGTTNYLVLWENAVILP